LAISREGVGGLNFSYISLCIKKADVLTVLALKCYKLKTLCYDYNIINSQGQLLKLAEIDLRKDTAIFCSLLQSQFTKQPGNISTITLVSKEVPTGIFEIKLFSIF
jgi:hypothetical protein